MNRDLGTRREQEGAPHPHHTLGLKSNLTLKFHVLSLYCPLLSIDPSQCAREVIPVFAEKIQYFFTLDPDINLNL